MRDATDSVGPEPFLFMPCWYRGDLEEWSEDEPLGLWVGRVVATDLDQAVRLTTDLLVNLLLSSASKLRSQSVHAVVFRESNQDPDAHWGLADRDPSGQVAQASRSPTITVRHWIAADSVLVGVVLDPEEPPCTGGDHLWSHELPSGDRCALCHLRREMTASACAGDCYLRFSEIEYLRASADQ
jgi:hypothetical protein